MTIKEAIREIRHLMSRCECSEKEVYEALVEESEGWRMRLKELEEEEDEEEEEEE